MWTILLDTTDRHRSYDYHLSLQITKIWLCPLFSNSLKLNSRKIFESFCSLWKCLSKILCYIRKYLTHKCNVNTLQKAYFGTIEKQQMFTDVFALMGRVQVRRLWEHSCSLLVIPKSFCVSSLGGKTRPAKLFHRPMTCSTCMFTSGNLREGALISLGF